MGKKLDLVGQVFGYLTVIKEGETHINPKGKKIYRWLCLCSCGVKKEVIGSKLRRGDTTSCGCYQKEIVSKNNLKHGLYYTPEYRIWNAMIQRCLNPNNKRYADYGGRGITVCDEWINSFEAFYNYIGKRPSSEYSIDRTDNNKGYKPGNVRWATTTVQKINQRISNKNTSGYRGVHWSKKRQKWVAQIKISNKNIYLGRFNNIEDAINARKLAEEKYHNIDRLLINK